MFDNFVRLLLMSSCSAIFWVHYLTRIFFRRYEAPTILNWFSVSIMSYSILWATMHFSPSIVAMNSCASYSLNHSYFSRSRIIKDMHFLRILRDSTGRIEVSIFYHWIDLQPEDFKTHKSELNYFHIVRKDFFWSIVVSKLKACMNWLCFCKNSLGAYLIYYF